MARAIVFSVEAFACLVLLVGLAFFFQFSSLDSKKDFYRRQLAEDFAEASLKSDAFSLVEGFDSAHLASFYLKAASAVGVSCVKFGFDDVRSVGCLNETTFFTASRSVFSGGLWREYSVSLGFD